jgi:mannitol-specific phosphotransferase system IIBC component|tara:strand:- start:2381 stop:2776 length:396 start_codon:yes stop_codon:yes gene_type:complete
MKEILMRLFGKGTDVAGKVGGLVDRFVRTKDEKAEFEKEMTKILIDAEADMQKNVTDRWKADMGSDSWLSKNVRPLVLMFLIFNTMLLIFIDAGQIKFKVEDNWVDLLQVLLLTVIAAYFGGRTVEKTRKK